MAILKPSPSSPSRQSSGELGVLVDKLGGFRGADAHLVLELADGEAGGVFGADEGRDVARGLGSVACNGKEDGDFARLAGGDPGLRAVDYVSVAATFGGGAHGSGVGAGVGLGEGVGAEPLAACQFGKVVGFLFGSAKGEQGAAHERVVDGDDGAEGGEDAVYLLQHEDVGEHVRLRAAVLFGDQHAREAKLGHFVEDFAGEDVALVPLFGVRLQFAQCEVAGGIADELLFGVEGKVHGLPYEYLTRLGFLCALEDLAGDHEALDLGGAFADFGQADVAIVALDVGLGDVAEAAVDLDGFVAAFLAHFGGEELGHGGFFGEGLIVVLEPGGLIDQQAGGIQLCRHVGQLELDGLEVGDGLAELLRAPWQ